MTKMNTNMSLNTEQNENNIIKRRHIMKIENGKNYICFGNNLNVLKNIDSETIDAVIIDPPFNTDREFQNVNETAKTVQYFNDSTKGGIHTFIEEIRIRIIQIHRILKNTGSFCIHCDSAASHYLKVEIDKIFGDNNFINEIIWKRTTNSGALKYISNKLPRNHDTILWYVKDRNNYTFNKLFRPWPEKEIEWRFPYNENDGKGPYHWNTYTWTTDPTDPKLKDLLDKGEAKPPGKSAKYYSYKVFLSKNKGCPIDTIWDDIKPIHGQTKNKNGLTYPTQKPVELYERLIQMTTNEGDIVLDSYMGSGTTLLAAKNLGRLYIGIDFSPTAVQIAKERLSNSILNFDKSNIPTSFEYISSKFDYNEVINMDKFYIQKFLIEDCLKGVDFGNDNNGIDGEVVYEGNQIPVQVKAGMKGASQNDIKHFFASLVNENKTEGILVAFSFSKSFYSHQVEYKKKGYNIIDIKIGDLIDINMPIKMTLTNDDKTKNIISTIEDSPNGKIVNFMWSVIDKNNNEKVIIFNSNSNIIKYKNYEKYCNTGLSLKCKVTDECGCETIEVISI